ncbi:MAG: HAD family hydrolase [Phycisphaerales bacterium]|nr:MAG: HAD family hydrolase [Phycisphaerales bacterium]
MPDRKVKAVLFDLGETLINFGKVSTTRLFRQGARLSYDFLREHGQPVGHFEWYCWANLLRLRIRLALSNLTGKDVDAMALLRKVGTRKGVRFNPEQWRQFAWLWYEPLSKVATVEPKTSETLTSLAKLGLKLGIVSNTFVSGCSLDKHLKQLGILDFFSVRVYSHDFDFRKPSVQIFKVAAEKIGEVFENILYVGDRVDKDIRPAVKAGMQVVLKEAYTNAGKKTPDGAWRVGHLAELPSLVENINARVSAN